MGFECHTLSGTHGGSINLKRKAERVGFEPTVTRRTTTVFETAPIGHSGTSPMGQIITESRAIAYSRDGRAVISRNSGLRLGR